MMSLKTKRLELSLIQMQKNEADDQFAIVQAILTPKFRLEGIVAAHYKAGFAAQYGGAPVKDSMMQSYAEVEKILDLMNVKNEIPHFKGCKVPVGEGWEEAEGVDFIIDRAMAEDSILHLIVLGPLTNVAAALKKKSPGLMDWRRPLSLWRE